MIQWLIRKLMGWWLVVRYDTADDYGKLVILEEAYDFLRTLPDKEEDGKLLLSEIDHIRWKLAHPQGKR